MKVNVMKVPSPDANSENELTLMQVDELYTIMVKGFGYGDYRWKVIAPPECHGWAAFVRDHAEPLDAQGFYGPEWLGLSLTWAEPLTFAHVVMDLINNQ